MVAEEAIAMGVEFTTLAPLRPEREQALGWLREGRSVPLYREVLADLETPVSAYLKLAGDSPSFLLESIESSERLGRFSFLGGDPYMVLSMRDGIARFRENGGERSEPFTDPMAVIDAELARRNAVALPELPRFQGGAVGYLGYETVRYFEDLPLPAKDDLNLPDIVLMFVDTLVVFDHLTHSMKLVAHAVSTGDPEADYDRAVERIDSLAHQLASPATASTAIPAANKPGGGPLIFNRTREDFEEAVRKARDYITAGDIIQVVLSLRIARELTVPAFTVYRFLRTVNPSPYMFFLDLQDMQVVGASPEMLVQAEGRRIRTRPIAGSRPRGADPEADEAMARELLADEKERAEHVMLVDLGRNDIGRVARRGSVEVTDFMSVEKFSHIMHIVSQVEGDLDDGETATGALRACFPAGTLSGAPKIRAMEIIAELEPTSRGLYGGAVGYFSFSGDIDTAITIRTMLAKDGYGYVQAGAGIVADSDPATEFEECQNKARALLRAIDLAQEAG
jgi:anthranilate synthase component 1